MSASVDTITIYDGSELDVLERPRAPGERLVMRFRLLDRCGAPPPHVHPGADEVFTVEEGEFELLVGSEWRTVRAGESVTVAAGTRHTFRNHSGATVVVHNVHSPHHEFEAYIRALAALSHELEATTPNSPRAAAKLALIWRRHRDLIRPADLPMRLALPVLAAVGRLFRLSTPAP